MQIFSTDSLIERDVAVRERALPQQNTRETESGLPLSISKVCEPSLLSQSTTYISAPKDENVQR